MIDRTIYSTLLATTFAVTSSAFAQDDDQSPPTTPDAETTEAAETPAIEVPETFAPLLAEFRDLATKIKAAGNNTMTDRDAILDLRDRVIAFNEQRTPTETSLAAELQLLQWGSSSPDQQSALFARLDDLDIKHPGLRLYWAMDLLQRQARPTRALRVLEEHPIDLAEYPVAGVLRAQAQIAQNEFAGAIESLDAIPADAEGRADMLDRMYQLRKQVEELEEDWQREADLRAAEAAADDLPRVEFKTNKGNIVVELFENEAPNTIANFISLVESGYYNNTTFSRIMPGTQVNAGDPTARQDLVTSAELAEIDYSIPDETEPGVYRRHFAGTVAMANLMPNTAAAEIMFNLRARPERDGRSTVFGRVVEGREILEQIEEEDQIESATVLRKRDHDYAFEKVGDKQPNDETTEGEDQDESDAADGEVDEEKDDEEVASPDQDSTSDDGNGQ